MTAIERQGWRNIRDQNGTFADGYAPVAHSHTDDRRMGAAWCYLTADVRRRPNLTIMGETEAERIVFEGRRAVGVEVRRGGEVSLVRAREVIFSRRRAALARAADALRHRARARAYPRSASRWSPTGPASAST